MRLRLSHSFLLSTMVLCLSALDAPAQTYTWAPGGDQLWSNASNWSPATVPNAASVTAVFNGTTVTQVDVDGSFTLGRLRFDPNGTPETTYTFSGSGSLAFDNGASPGVIESFAGSGGYIQPNLSVPIAIAGSSNALQINNGGNAAIRILGQVSGSASAVTINAGGVQGVVWLEGTNSYGGTGSITTVAGGTLRANDGTGLPSNTALDLNGGVFETSTGQTFSRSLGTGSGEVRLAGRAGFSVFIGTTNIRLNNGTGTVTWGSVTFNPTTLVIGASRLNEVTKSSLVIFENGLNLGSATRTISAESLLNEGQNLGRISGVISNGGLTKSGNGILELTAANTYSGPTTITAGILRATSGAGLPTASALSINGGILESMGATTFSRSVGTGSGQVELVSGGFSARDGPMTIQLNGGTGTQVWGSGNFFAGGGTLALGSTVSNALVDFQNGIDLGGAQRTVSVGASSLSADARARLSGPISNGSLNLIGTGPAVLELTGNNTYTGETRAQDLTLRANSGQGLPTGSLLTLENSVLESLGAATFTRYLGAGAGEVRLSANSGFSASGGKFEVLLNGGGTITFGQAHFVPDATTLVFGSATANDLVEFQNGLDLAGKTQTIRVNDNSATIADRARITGIITNGALTKEGPGVLELTGANTYSDPTTVNGGALRALHGTGLPSASPLLLDNLGVIESIGNVTFTRSLGSGAGEVEIGGGGGGFSAFGGVMTVQLNGGTGAVTLGVPLVLGSTSSNNLVDFQNSLALGGNTQEVYSFGGQARISGVIDNGSLTKLGPGSLELTNANTYGGATIVESGRLLINNLSGSATGTSDVEIRATGTLGGHGKIVNAKSVTVASGARIAPGDAGGNTIGISSTGSITLDGTWAVKLHAPGSPSAANTGGSTSGTVSGSKPDPVNHTFLDLSTNGQANKISFGSSSTWEIDGTGLTILPYTSYSYVIGRAGVGEVNTSSFPITDQSRFSTIGFGATGFSVTSQADGRIILNFTSTPEPAATLAIAVAGMSAFGAIRRRTRR